MTADKMPEAKDEVKIGLGSVTEQEPEFVILKIREDYTDKLHIGHITLGQAREYIKNFIGFFVEDTKVKSITISIEKELR